MPDSPQRSKLIYLLYAQGNYTFFDGFHNTLRNNPTLPVIYKSIGNSAGYPARDCKLSDDKNVVVFFGEHDSLLFAERGNEVAQLIYSDDQQRSVAIQYLLHAKTGSRINIEDKMKSLQIKVNYLLEIANLDRCFRSRQLFVGDDYHKDRQPIHSPCHAKSQSPIKSISSDYRSMPLISSLFSVSTSNTTMTVEDESILKETLKNKSLINYDKLDKLMQPDAEVIQKSQLCYMLPQIERCSSPSMKKQMSSIKPLSSYCSIVKNTPLVRNTSLDSSFADSQLIADSHQEPLVLNSLSTTNFPLRAVSPIAKRCCVSPSRGLKRTADQGKKYGFNSVVGQSVTYSQSTFQEFKKVAKLPAFK